MNDSMQNYVQRIKQFKYKTKLATQMREAKSWWTEYGFCTGNDYSEVIVKNDENSKGGRPAMDYEISVDIGM